MKFAFFPGCVLKGAAAEAYTSMQKVCDALGIELEEIPNWTCCGASHAQGVNDLAALAVNARNISIAENMGLPILTVCNTCTLQLRTAKYRLDHDKDLRDKVNAILKEAGHPYEYKGTSEITHFLWVLDDHPELFEGKVTDACRARRSLPITAATSCARRTSCTMRTASTLSPSSASSAALVARRSGSTRTASAAVSTHSSPPSTTC